MSKKPKAPGHSLLIVLFIIGMTAAAVLVMLLWLPRSENMQTAASSSSEPLSSLLQSSSAMTPSPSSETIVSDLEQQVLQKLSEMTLEEKVAQLFMITPEDLTGKDTATQAGGSLLNALQKYPVGGLIFFGKNLVSPRQLAAMTGSIQKHAEETQGMPLLLGIDEEGGSVARIANNGSFPVEKFSDMASVGASEDYDKAYRIGSVIGAYLYSYGFNLDFAPDADVLTNPDNTVIGARSFGSDPEIVAKMDLQVARGLADNQVYPCFKHFPGHGATEGDTHEGFAYTGKTLDEMVQAELVPFQAAVDRQIPFIMVSHISAPNVTGNNLPASLSSIMMTDVLRNQMGYDGIIITDSMKMGAIINHYGTEKTALTAFLAGADMILMPQDFITAYQNILDAVADGTVSEQRLDDSVRRILHIKLALD